MNGTGIDWEMIWKEHSPYYRDGKFYLELENGERIFFRPGPAFGDGSHATTNLMLEHLKAYVEDKVVVDLGAGSGVLSMAASKLGSKKVFALEIDLAATETMKKNIKLNNIQNISINQTPDDFDIVLVNMISSEQKIAFESHPYLLKKGLIVLVSGILSEEKDQILEGFGFPKLLYSQILDPWALLIVQL
ncbi:MAG: Ribosomal protein L11 methyltransferase [Chlamydiia bacterium]|nr:Ribosomal protein L11 methyltransferase [Chlamydiia bacterium]